MSGDFYKGQTRIYEYGNKDECLNITLSPGNYHFEVWGAQGGEQLILVLEEVDIAQVMVTFQGKQRYMHV